ncbi:MAG: 2-dehydropantoate 2-reductase [Clostridia bacterium]
MKIAIIGAGAMGCLYGGYLSKKHDVIMVDSYEPQVDALNKNGIIIEQNDNSSEVFSNVKAYLSGNCDKVVDLIIVFVKSTYTEQALAQNKALFHENTLVMTLQNGAGNDRKIAQYIDPLNIIVGTSKYNAVNLGDGKTRHAATGATTIGSNHNQTDKLEVIKNTFEECGFEICISDDIQRIIWSKLFVNLSVNTFTALIETPIGYMVQDKYAWDFAKRLIYEAVEVAEADGTYFDRREALEMVKKVCYDAGDGYSSMYQDRKKRVEMEIDAINGAIVEQAKMYGVPTPYNSIIVDLIHALEGAYKFYD